MSTAGLDLSRTATSFLVSAIKKSKAELRAVLTDPAKLEAVAQYRRIKIEWARFWIADELNRSERKGK